jgi:RNA polymerase sigma-70 factor (ECF subfamily)
VLDDERHDVPMAVADPLRSLVDAAREGDDVAVRELVRHTQLAVWRLCSALGSPGEEDDLVQETYLRAFRALDSYRGDAPFQPWLLSIARRVCADHVRRRVRQRRLVDRISRSLSPNELPDLDGSTELLAVLSDDRREAFVLTQIVGLSYEDAAVAADCPIGTIRSRVARARADLLVALRASEAV